ncbi:MAG: mannose-6-phosphate isomerase [Clostridiales bacterium]|nr:mannose-6-phosphate isomerase [Clostridiales bacterium]
MEKILRLNPALKDYIWGEDRLKAYFPTSLERVAEAWVCACHSDGKSTVAAGEYKGRTLEEVLSDNYSGSEAFPFLIKLIDSKQFLSIQVHPDDDYAQKNEGQPGKTEMWYIIDADEGAGIYYGFKEKISREEFCRHIEDNTLTDVLNFVPVRAGESYFIEAGTIHAIGSGLLIAEIQQNSNVTYRVYDYGRMGADGKPRELHIKQALDVTKTEPATNKQAPPATAIGDGQLTMLADCRYFKVQRLTLDGQAVLDLPDKHTALLVVSGEGMISEGDAFKQNDCFYLPSDTERIGIFGKCELLFVSA